MSKEITLKNINTADIPSLANLPGVGPSLAERIVNNRPYASIEELLKVKGIGSQSLEKIQGLITVEETELEDNGTPSEELLDQVTNGEKEPDDPIAEPEDSFAEPDDFLTELEEEVPEDKEVEKEPTDLINDEASISEEISTAEKEPEKPVTRSQVKWIAFSSALIAFVLAIALTFGMLTSLNGGLYYAPQSQAATIERQVDGLTAQADTLSQDIEILAQDIEGLRKRIDNLDNLSNQVKDLEKQLTNTEAEIKALSEQLSELENNSQRFQTFFEELQQILNTLFESEETQ